MSWETTQKCKFEIKVSCCFAPQMYLLITFVFTANVLTYHYRTMVHRTLYLDILSKHLYTINQYFYVN